MDSYLDVIPVEAIFFNVRDPNLPLSRMYGENCISKLFKS